MVQPGDPRTVVFSGTLESSGNFNLLKTYPIGMPSLSLTPIFDGDKLYNGVTRFIGSGESNELNKSVDPVLSLGLTKEQFLDRIASQGRYLMGNQDGTGQLDIPIEATTITALTHSL
ncbi:hypothetical protein JCM19239_3521 [Vibrio variabilis]|uniref:Uncharacterized protein n=1 Tax=Vibrio variabilis TaxID=990271 RepID=A0ABQ0JRB9_9VIBR|nr:hypothetical protein JCM19239_3521 [Vibrio variabilis]